MQKVTLIPGDGIGPEIAKALEKVFAAAKIPVLFEKEEAGIDSLKDTGELLPKRTIESILKNKIAIKGPTTTPISGGHKSINVSLRQKLNLFANVRPVKTIRGLCKRYDDLNLDMLIVRENTEDLYAGLEHSLDGGETAISLKVITRKASQRINRYAFEAAKKLQRKKVTCVHKANIMKETDGLFLDTFRKVGADYPDIQKEELIVDNCSMQLVVRPETFDVIVTENLYGDILSDLCSGLVGGLGVAPGGNIGENCAVFEAVHGSAPDIAGKNLANPTALLLSSCSMLEHMLLINEANQLRKALIKTLEDPTTRTKDIGGTLTTEEFSEAVIKNL